MTVGASRPQKFLSTPSARRATGSDQWHQRQHCISIHALREEGDSTGAPGPHGPKRISIHALREEGDYCFPSAALARSKFLSTPSARRATAATLTLRAQIENFYPRPPRGGRRAARTTKRISKYFYPRPPRGGRPQIVRRLCRILGFLSTPSARRATPAPAIKAQHENHFYPRPPRGGRLTL